MYNKVLIVGAGPAGLCLALALARQGTQVALLERQAEDLLGSPAGDGREVALTHASMRFLREIGVWAHIPSADVVPLRQARILDRHDPGFEVSARPFDRDQLGTLVSNHLIRAAAWRAASEHPHIHIHTGSSVERVMTSPSTAHVQLAGGKTLDAALLVAADGRHSQTRRAMGIATYMHDFGRSMLLCRMTHEQPGDGTAWQWFGRDMTRAILPVSEHVSSVILTMPEAAMQPLLDLSQTDFAQAVARHLEYRFGAMELTGERHSYPMVGTWARRFVGTRFALVGDAAIGMHPVTAHGFNTGLASAERLAWAAAFGQRRWQDVGHPRALARYERQHRLGSAAMFAGTQLVARLFENDSLLARPLRQGIMRAGRDLPVLQRALAAGLLDEAPRPASLPHQLRRTLDILRPRRRHADRRAATPPPTAGTQA
ncbi:MAG: 5-demethoxyubiquinol-8 5-hydroxylase UbiM [Ottowia sp.]|nr:5-demethoxyubiquinol-8 5-hydroxylase UbiM [Ottowia sp.]